MTLDKDKIQDLPEDCGSKKTNDKPWLFTSKSIMCAVYCQSVEEDCEVTKYAGNNECHFIHRNVVSEGMLTKDLGNSVEMHSSQPLTATDSNNPDIALDKNIAAGSVDPNTSPPETIVSDIRAQCFNSTPPDLFCTLNTDSYFTVDLASIKNIATIRFWTAASTQNAQTIKLADIYVSSK
ncbi:hypothetical protein FHG87_006889 [Trinorchestia longiramus]|nr:hypothetical protein FHG87_006889 [Trinorchestia longiramus]